MYNNNNNKWLPILSLMMVKDKFKKNSLTNTDIPQEVMVSLIMPATQPFQQILMVNAVTDTVIAKDQQNKTNVSKAISDQKLSDITKSVDELKIEDNDTAAILKGKIRLLKEVVAKQQLPQETIAVNS